MGFTASAAASIPAMVSAYSATIGWMDRVLSSSVGSATYEGAQVAVYVPVRLPSTCTAMRVWWGNGATVTGGATIEVGIYANSGYGPGAKLVSGSATQGSASQVQFVDVTDTTLSPGIYWIAILSSSATNTTLMRSATFTAHAATGYRLEQSGLAALPATATPVQSTGGAIYLCGFATTASP